MQISLWLDQNSIYLRSDRMLRLAPIVQWKITVRLGYIDSLAATLKSIPIILMQISKCNIKMQTSKYKLTIVLKLYNNFNAK